MPLNSAEIATLEKLINRFCDGLPAPTPEDRPLLEDAKSALLTGFVLLAHATGAGLDDVRPKDYVDGLNYAIEVIRSWSDTKRMDRLDPIVQSIAADIQAEKLRVESLGVE